jgi:hypothetical protein
MSAFFREEDLRNRHELSRLLKRLFPTLEVNQYNLEEVLGFLDLSRARTARWGIGNVEDQALLDVLSHDLLEYVRERLAIPTNGVCNRHLKLFQQLGAADSVLTLNYDLIVDQALRGSEMPAPEVSRLQKLGVLLSDTPFLGPTPPSLTKKETTGGFYLKLHGSINWLVCSNGKCPHANNIYVAWEQSEEGQRPGTPCRVCGDAIRALIVPPVASKGAAAHHLRLPLLWNLAMRQLMAADTITIIGVSFAPSDSELRWLFRQALYVRPKIPLRVEIVNPRKDDRERTVDVLPASEGEAWHFTTLDDYLDKKPPVKVERLA